MAQRMVQFLYHMSSKIKIQKFLAVNFYDRSLDKAKVALGTFLNRGKDECKGGTEKTKMKLMTLCCKRQDAKARWTEVKNHLINNIETLLPYRRTPAYRMGERLAKLRGSREIAENLVPHYYVLVHVLDNVAYLHECIKLVVLFNFLMSDTRQVPEDVRIYYADPANFNTWHFRHERVHIRVKLSNHQNKEIELPWQEFLKNRGYYSLLETVHGHTVNQHLMEQEKFFERFNNQFPEIVKTNHLTKTMKPSQILVVLLEWAQRKFLEGLTGTTITKWQWLKELEMEIHNEVIAKKIVNQHGITQEDINELDVEALPLWKPNYIYFDADALSYEFAELYVSKLPSSDKEELVFQAAGDISYGIFNIPSLLDIVNTWRSTRNFKKLRFLNRILSTPYSQSAISVTETQRNYWRIYLDVERMVERRGYTKQKAYKEIAERYETTANTIASRYKERALEARKSGLTAEEIITRYNLYEFEEVHSL